MRELASIQYIHKPSHNVVCEVDDMLLCDGNYGLGAYGMYSVHGDGKGGDGKGWEGRGRDGR